MGYFTNALKNPRETIDVICHAIKDPKFSPVEFIVGTGISGTLVLLPVSMKSGIPYGAIRKEIDAKTEHDEGGSHSHNEIETYETRKTCRYIIIDDFIESGNTIQRIKKVMTKEWSDSHCAGIILYESFAPPSKYLDEWGDIPTSSLYYDIVNLTQ